MGEAVTMLLADQLTLARWRADRMAFREALVMPDGRPFGVVMADFQRADFAALDAVPRRHLYCERPRGASKTSDLAAEAVAELFLGPPGGRLYAAAVDRDQAALLHEAAAGWIRRTPLLAQAVTIERWRIIVRGTDSVLTVLSADAPSTWGLSPTWICADELGQWPEREGEDLWSALWTAAPKRKARVLAITTPGWDKAGLCWKIRELAATSSRWHFSALTEPAPWIDPAFLEEQRESLPEHVFRRLHLGAWTDSGGAFLSASEVDACFTEDVPQATGPVAIGVDLGLTRDACAVAVARRDNVTGLIVLEALFTWQGRQGAKVDLREVRGELATLARHYAAPVVLETWQAALMAQDLRQEGAMVVEWNPSAEGRRRLFSTLLDLVRTGKLRSRPHPALRRELLALQVVELPSGWRVDHPSGHHDDHAVAAGLAVLHVADQAPIDLKGGTFLGKPRGSSKLFASGLPRHTGEEGYDRRAIWKDTPWGDLR